ncbi:hypothetical protein PtA15_8A376 [Puccinia triticina]|uniref:Mannosyltransferase n=1 Tax=Puccinia triticina TaxID=208348 RepID=A0ABY7CSM4_9BASI|nr:uncharacterized protein PtA15_8A376 [Puccinia triticina]WAQ87472.1 hypothetical protein PtA15_8A376 [Puccinia triticina]
MVHSEEHEVEDCGLMTWPLAILHRRVRGYGKHCPGADSSRSSARRVKDIDEFDGHQLTKRFGIKQCVAQEEAKKLPMSYDAEMEKTRALDRGAAVKKIWCRRCMPQQTSEFFCSDCEQKLHRAKFAQAQLSKHKSDEDRLCKDCADLTMRKVEAVRVGEEYEADEIENTLKARRVAKDTVCLDVGPAEGAGAGDQWEEESGAGADRLGGWPASGVFKPQPATPTPHPPRTRQATTDPIQRQRPTTQSAMLPAGVQTIRFRKPTNDSAASKAAESSEKLKAAKHVVVKDTLIAEQINRNRPPWVPKLSVAFRILVLVRFCAAMYSSISDCDETFNFWEPTHYLVHGKGFQTWEYSPDYAIRSWFFVLLHSFPAWLASKAFPLDKRPGFFAIRAMLAFLSSYTEAKLYRAIADHINPRAARYYLSMSLFSAAMWSASSAYLPSAFAMQAISLAFSYVLEPVSSKSASGRRTFFACLFFVIATVAGWPFVGVLALPFAFEELSLCGDDEVMPASRPGWAASRFNRLFVCGLASLVLVSVPLVFVDWLAYGKLLFVPLNIVLYNVFPHKFGSGVGGGGPELYGTEPSHFYLLNLLLNFNIVFILALLSIPLVLFTSRFSKSRGVRLGQKLRLANQTPSAHLLIVRLLPVYAWIALMSQQPHKEERFMQPIYTLISFNAAVSLSLIRGWMEDIFVKITSSPYRAGQTSIFSTVTRTVIMTSSCIAIARILALQNYYHAPLDLMFHFQYNELPVRAIQTYPAEYAYLGLNTTKPILEAIEHAEYTVDLGPLAREKLTLCLGESWFRFPTQFLVPDPINVQFVKGPFEGILPAKFISSPKKDQFDGPTTRPSNSTPSHPFSEWLWRRKGTRTNGGKFNTQNKEEIDRYVDPETQCSYAIGLNYPHRSAGWRGNEFEDGALWEPRKCVKMLDGQQTPTLFRTLWLPLSWWTDAHVGERKGKLSFAELCLYKRTA